jgi:hypothetical protein
MPSFQNMIYFYNYNFIKYLNSAWSFLFLLIFANIALLLLTSTCLADEETNLNLNPNLNSNLEDKEVINNVSETNIIAKVCKESNISISDALLQTKMDAQEIERAKQTPDLQVRLVEADIFFEAEKQRKAQASAIVLAQNKPELGAGWFSIESNNFNNLSNSQKFILGVSAAGLSGGGLTTKVAPIYFPPCTSSLNAYKVPFILNSVPVHKFGRTGTILGAGLFIGGVCSGYIDLSTLDPAVVESLIK